MAKQEIQDEAKCAGSQQEKSAEKGESGADKAYTGVYAETCNVRIQTCKTLAM